MAILIWSLGAIQDCLNTSSLVLDDVQHPVMNLVNRGLGDQLAVDGRLTGDCHSQPVPPGQLPQSFEDSREKEDFLPAFHAISSILI